MAQPVSLHLEGTPESIRSAIAGAAVDLAALAIVAIGAGRAFVAGAGIREFGEATGGEKPRRSLLPLLLGGGLEVARTGGTFTDFARQREVAEEV